MNLLGLTFFCISSLFSQTKDVGIPVGWNKKLNPNNIPLEIMKGYSQSKIDAEDLINDATKDKPWRFGYKYDVNFTLQNAGLWTTLPNGDKLWQLAIECKNALTINLIFEDFDLPNNAHLHIYDLQRTNRVGAYTNRNNRKDGLLGTELVHGENIIVEYFEPKNVNYSGNFKISNVVHGYRPLSIIQQNLLIA